MKKEKNRGLKKGTFMFKTWLKLPILVVIVLFAGTHSYGKPNIEKMKMAPENKKILIAYFSHSGNTREIANQIQKNIGGEVFEIQPVKPYPQNYDSVVQQARQELDSGYKPALKTKVKDIREYDIVFIGYPNWWGTIPAPVRVFLTEYDFSGKTIVPFCTHGGSGLSRSMSDIAKLCPKSTMLDGLAIWGNEVGTTQTQVAEWLKKIGIMK